jgi:thermitase
MSDSKTPTLDPTDGTTPITLPTQDACCQVPCDPPWVPGAACVNFQEIRFLILPLEGTPATGDFNRGEIIITIVYSHHLCLTGKQHGPLAYTLTLLPGEKMTLYQSDRYRRTTSETERFSVQTTFFQFVSAVHAQNTSSDVSLLNQVLNSQTQSAGGSGGINLGLFSIGGGGGESSSSSSASQVSVQAASDSFFQTAAQASQYTDVQRGLTISSYEDSESVSTTSRTLVNNNACYAVNYFVRKVMDVYTLTTTVNAITFQVIAGNFKSGVLTPAQVGQLPAALQGPVEAALKGLPKVGANVTNPQVIAVPTDGVVYDPELAHCCAQDPALEQEVMIRLEREQAEAQRVGLEIQLMALEVQRRQALLAAGTLTPFEPAETENIIA